MGSRSHTSAMLAGLLTGVICNSAQALVINEIRIDQTGSDNDEFFELAGQAHESLQGISYLVLGDASGDSSGVVESVTDLSGLQLDSRGLFLAAESSFSLGATPSFFTNLNFENSDSVTHLLVRGFSGHRGDDLDDNGDGRLDTTPWIELLDSFAFVADSSSDSVYSPHRLNVSKPSHAYRTDFSTPQWQTGTWDTAQDTPNALNRGQAAWLTTGTPTIVSVPLPGTLSLLALGLASLCRQRWTRWRAARH